MKERHAILAFQVEKRGEISQSHCTSIGHNHYIKYRDEPQMFWDKDQPPPKWYKGQSVEKKDLILI